MSIHVSNESLCYESVFHSCQIEITGKCNFYCKHCRAATDPVFHMEEAVFRKALEFADPVDDTFILVISGGEPFLHPFLPKLLHIASVDFRIKRICITTNGSCYEKSLLEAIREATKQVNELLLQVSLDFPTEKDFDAFRGYKGAFQSVENFIKRAKEMGFLVSQSSIIVPQNLDKMEVLVQQAIERKIFRIGFDVVLPIGRASQSPDLCLNKEATKNCLQHITFLKEKYHGVIEIVTESPLKFLCGKSNWDYGEYNIHSLAFFGGCTAGIDCFNVYSDGTLSFCAALPVEVLNLKPHINTPVEELWHIYESSDLTRALFSRRFHGKCGKCSLKRLCGGCRARAFAFSGTLLGEDPLCWR